MANNGKRGKKIADEYSAINEDLIDVFRLKWLNSLQETIAITLAHESAHALEVENNWNNRLDMENRINFLKLKYSARNRQAIFSQLSRDREYRRYARNNNLIYHRLENYFRFLKEVRNDDRYGDYSELEILKNSFNSMITMEECFITYPYGIEVEQALKLMNRGGN